MILISSTVISCRQFKWSVEWMAPLTLSKGALRPAWSLFWIICEPQYGRISWFPRWTRISSFQLLTSWTVRYFVAPKRDWLSRPMTVLWTRKTSAAVVQILWLQWVFTQSQLICPMTHICIGLDLTLMYHWSRVFSLDVLRWKLYFKVRSTVCTISHVSNC